MRRAPLLGLGMALSASVAFAQAQPPVYVPPVGGATARPPAGANTGTVIVSPPAQGRQPGQSVAPGGPWMVDPNAQPSTGSTADPHYRLVATSFRVDHQTVDDMLELDGRGDEIFVRADVYGFGADSRPVGHRTVKSAVFGAHSEIRAGSGPAPFNAADDQPGGLVTNDLYPPQGDNFSTRLSGRANDLPLILWDGRLAPGSSVVVVPSVWEWDSPGPSRSEEDWGRLLDHEIQLRIVQHIPSGVFQVARGDGINRALLAGIAVHDDGNRPIGAVPANAEAGVPLNAIVLTADSAEQMASRALVFPMRTYADDGTVVGNVEVRGPPGGTAVEFDDPPQFEGRYTLYLRLERLP